LQPVSLQQLNSALSPYATSSAVAATYAPLANPVFTGAPQVPTASAGANSTQAASTQFVQTTVATGPSANNVGRNLVQNALYNVAQRGSGPWTTNVYTADRWQIAANLDTVSMTLFAMTDAYRSDIADETASWNLSNTFGGNAGAASFNAITQKIERVRRLAGKTVTVSFWAVGSTTLRLGVGFGQNFGTGGSPSAGVAINGQSVTISGTYARYSLTFALPSAAGKTLGTNNDDFTQLTIWFSGGSANNAATGNVGVQSGTINLWGVQLEIGSVATPLEKIDPGEDLRRCQRFFVSGARVFDNRYGNSGSGTQATYVLPQPMRATPTIVVTTQASSNVTSPAVNALTTASVYAGGSVTSTGGLLLDMTFSASADL
jgi:hypothetical protein